MMNPNVSDDYDDNEPYVTGESSDFSGDEPSSESDDGRSSDQDAKDGHDDCFESPLQSLESELFNTPRIYSSKYMEQFLGALCCGDHVNPEADESSTQTIKAATLKLSTPQGLTKQSFNNISLSVNSSEVFVPSTHLQKMPSIQNKSSSIKAECKCSEARNETNEFDIGLLLTAADTNSKKTDTLQLRRRKSRHRRLQSSVEEKEVSYPKAVDLENAKEKSPSLKLSSFIKNPHDVYESLLPKQYEHLSPISPNERYQFFKSFSHLVRQGRRERHTADRKLQRMGCTEFQLLPKELQYFIWMELLAWHKGCSVEHQENILSLQQHAIQTTLEEVLNFYVRDAKQSDSSKRSASSVFQLREDVNTQSTTIDNSISLYSSTLYNTHYSVVDGCSQENSPSDHNLLLEPKIIVTTKLPTINCESGQLKTKLNEMGELKSMQKVVESLEKSHIDLLNENPNEQSSNYMHNESGSSPVISNELGCECSDTLSQICQNCVVVETEALNQVTMIINKLDKIEHLYPSSRFLNEHYPVYNSPEFICRLKTLHLWYNVTIDLRQKIDLLANLFGIKNRAKAGWPCYREEICVDPKENSPTKCEAINVALKKVHFKNLSPALSSPNTSGSDISERSKSSFPSSPDVQLANPFDIPSSSSSSLAHEGCHNHSQSIYRKYVDHNLRHKGLKNIYRQLFLLLRPILYRLHAALKRPKPKFLSDADPKVVTDPPSSSGKTTDSLLPIKREYLEELSMYGVWSESFQNMALPTFHRSFFFLLRVLLDVIHECLLLRLQQQPSKPSSLSVGQLIKECKEVLRAATQTRQRYINLAQTVLGEGGNEIVEAQLDCFDWDLEKMLQVYLQYLQHRILMMQNVSQLTYYQKSYLEEEWSFVRVICPHIPGGEALAAKRFCFMSRYLLSSIGVFLTEGVNKHIAAFHENNEAEQSDASPNRKSLILHSCRKLKHIFHESSEKGRQVVTFAKNLRKDLEIAAEFRLLVRYDELLSKLRETGHIRVIAPHTSSHVMFIPGNLQHCQAFIWQLVDMTCGHEVLDPGSEQAVYLIMMQCGKGEFQGLYWNGPTMILEPTAEATITVSHVEVDGLLLVVNHSSQLIMQCKKFQKVMGTTLQINKQQTSCNHAIADALGDLKTVALELWGKLIQVVKEVELKLDITSLLGLDDNDRISLLSPCREVLHQGYRFGFEYQKAVTRLITGEVRNKFYSSLSGFAQQWMKFVVEKCEEGRGLRPKWVKQGLECIIAIYDSQCVQAMPEEEFEAVKQNLNNCIRHLLGCQEKSPIVPQAFPSPNTVASPMRVNLLSNRKWYRSHSMSVSRSDSLLSSPPAVMLEENTPEKRSKDEPISYDNENKHDSEYNVLPIARVRKKVELLEIHQQGKLLTKGAIGHVSDVIMQHTPLHISARRVTFPWQRCFKIGEGRFGKVYTAVNNATGELIAMKEIRLQPNDHRAIKEAMDEIRTFEGIKHRNLVRYYGVEVHREEMLIFMEYCNEGALESAVQLQLPESLIRKYTRQLLEAINVLHEHNIVHRDIKSANIFLTSDGNLKLGDFGCSIKLKNNTTMPGELCGFVGTPAYMAPEVFTKNIEGGHGRAADVWSLGCVVLEMVTAERPWHELENSYQIMFAVGMGGVPDIPESLSDEGQCFLSKCLVFNPSERWTTSQLLDHPFTKVHDDEYS